MRQLSVTLHCITAFLEHGYGRSMKIVTNFPALRYALYVKLIDDGNISSQYKTMPRMYFFLRISHFPDIKGEYDDESLS